MVVEAFRLTAVHPKLLLKNPVERNLLLLFRQPMTNVVPPLSPQDKVSEAGLEILHAGEVKARLPQFQKTLVGLSPARMPVLMTLYVHLSSFSSPQTSLWFYFTDSIIIHISRLPPLIKLQKKFYVQTQMKRTNEFESGNGSALKNFKSRMNC